ncbi:xyloglucanase [Streptomyces sp. NPDC088745]|uniref:xyloglucanase n=1 Tax=Streptomyces sp. NPDC088745 TaxID=3365884 RepID=UPI00381518F2
MYARTDIGGAYRLDRATRRWVPLTDWIGWDRYGHTGIISIATDETDPDRVYLAAGTYTLPDWDPSTAAILRSTDRGRTWRTTPLPFRLGGNMPGRGIGERLVIDPNRNRVLYLGVRGGHGLWRSTDHGKTFAKVDDFPNAGNFVPDPQNPDGYNGDNLGVLQVVFDKRTARAGRATRTLYVTVADKDNILYRSTDAGVTWERVPGQPTGFIPHHALFDHVNGFLYLATSDTAGPYDGAKGDVWKLDTATDAWTRISPVPSTSADNAYGYSGLTIDRRNPRTLMVSTQVSWSPDCILFRSTDGGATWTRAWDWTSQTERRLRYDMNISDAPWLTWNATPKPPESTPKLGWMMESVQIDPFDSDHFLYGTGATIYGSDNLKDWDTGGRVHLSVRAHGLEETAVMCLISPPAGRAHLFSGMGDVGGFRHTDFRKASKMYDSPTFGGTPALDFAELAPHILVRVGHPTSGWTQHFAVSTDAGDTWKPSGSEPAGLTGPGVEDQAVAVGADGRRVVWSPAGAPVSWSDDLGATWTASKGLPAGAPVRSDRVNPAMFYAYAAGVFYASTDGGRTFTATAAGGLPTAGNVRFKAVPGHEGDVWLAGGTSRSAAPTPYGMWRSTDAGRTFTRLTAVDEGDVVGFGKAAPRATYPAVFTSSKIGGVRGIFRSDDAGRTWLRVNDDRHQYGWTGSTITGDPRIHGRVYVGTNGRGVIYGDPKQPVDGAVRRPARSTSG